MTAARPTRACLSRVYWFDTRHVTTCRLRHGHGGWHFDGVRHFDDYGLQQPQDDTMASDLGWVGSGANQPA